MASSWQLLDVSLLDNILPLAVLTSTVLTIGLLLLPSRYYPRQGLSRITKGDERLLAEHSSRSGGQSATSVQILVLGDIGRSPRMQYHALSIAKYGGSVDLIGYRETEPHPDLLSSPLITIYPLPPPPSVLATAHRGLFLFTAPLKVAWQLLSLCWVLGYRTKPARWLLVQNPPAIPTLAVATLFCFLRNTHLVIDWHNLGWSILALKLGNTHPIVGVAKWYERFFGRWATANITVTDAMARVLKKEYHISAPILTLHDRPSEFFQPLPSQDRGPFLLKLEETKKEAANILVSRTRLLVSSTSWTADEDFSLLLDALVDYSKGDSSYESRPNILAVITGKGPQKEHYLKQIELLADKLSKVTILTAWLSVSDYARLLAAADLGVSLHMSSSGIDLPMKVVDMFGAGLPVLGWSAFEAWPELVQEGVNGRGFESAEQMSRILRRLFGGGEDELATLKQGALREGSRRWDDEWRPVVGRILGLCD